MLVLGGFIVGRQQVVPFDLADDGQALHGVLSPNPYQAKVHNILPLLFQFFRLKLFAHDDFPLVFG
jgi:hypothetical protein